MLFQNATLDRSSRHSMERPMFSSERLPADDNDDSPVLNERKYSIYHVQDVVGLVCPL